jgi:hypothetical protein
VLSQGALGEIITMKRTIFAAAAALGLLASTSAASAVTVWQGEAVVLQASGSCLFVQDERRNIGAGSVMKAVFRPSGVDNNGNATRLSFIHDSGALFAMLINGNPSANGDFVGFGATHSGEIVANRFAGYASYGQVPANVTAQTVFVIVTARVEDFMFLNGCDATFRAAFTRR